MFVIILRDFLKASNLLFHTKCHTNLHGITQKYSLREHGSAVEHLFVLQQLHLAYQKDKLNFTKTRLRKGAVAKSS